MYKNNRKIPFFILTFTLIFTCLLTCVNASEPISWYCIRNKGHRQPKLDETLSLIKGHNAIFTDEAHGDENNEKVVYLTFDAGYENGNIEKVLDILKEKNVQGSFFILGNLIKQNTPLVLRMFDEGHLVCNHTYSHKSMVNITCDDLNNELSKLNDTCIEYTGHEIAKFYRPPEGRFDEESLLYADKLGYTTVFWSIAYADWDNNKQASEEYALGKILDNMHNGAIILLHPTSSTNAKILAKLIDKLSEDGYTFGRIDNIGK